MFDKSIQIKIDNAQNNWLSIIGSISKWQGSDGETFVLSEIVPNISQHREVSIQDVDRKIRTILELSSNLGDMDDNYLVPNNNITQFSNCVDQISSQIQAFNDNLVSASNNHSARRNGQNLQIVNNNGNLIIDINKELQNVFNTSDNLLDNYYKISIITNNKSYPKLTAHQKIIRKTYRPNARAVISFGGKLRRTQTTV